MAAVNLSRVTVELPTHPLLYLCAPLSVTVSLYQLCSSLYFAKQDDDVRFTSIVSLDLCSFQFFFVLFFLSVISVSNQANKDGLRPSDHLQKHKESIVNNCYLLRTKFVFRKDLLNVAPWSRRVWFWKHVDMPDLCCVSIIYIYMYV